MSASPAPVETDEFLHITAVYHRSVVFKGPRYLLTPEFNSTYGQVGTWFIKHNTLHYINMDGKEVKVEPSNEVENERPWEALYNFYPIPSNLSFMTSDE